MVVLLQKNKTLSFTARPGRDNTFIVYPGDENTTTYLSTTKTLEDREVCFQFLDPIKKTTKGVLMGFPQSLPLDLIMQVEKVLSANRCTYNDHDKF